MTFEGLTSYVDTANCFVIHKIIAIPMASYFHVSSLPTFRLLCVIACEYVLFWKYAASLNVLFMIGIIIRTGTRPKCPSRCICSMFRFQVNIETNCQIKQILLHIYFTFKIFFNLRYFTTYKNNINLALELHLLL